MTVFRHETSLPVIRGNCMHARCACLTQDQVTRFISIVPFFSTIIYLLAAVKLRRYLAKPVLQLLKIQSIRKFKPYACSQYSGAEMQSIIKGKKRSCTEAHTVREMRVEAHAIYAWVTERIVTCDH